MKIFKTIFIIEEDPASFDDATFAIMLTGFEMKQVFVVHKPGLDADGALAAVVSYLADRLVEHSETSPWLHERGVIDDRCSVVHHRGKPLMSAMGVPYVLDASVLYIEMANPNSWNWME